MRISLYVIGGGDDVVVRGGVAGGVAAEEDAGAVELEGVMERVEHLRGDEATRQEHVSPVERPRPRRRRRRRRSHRLRSRSHALLFSLRISLSLSLSPTTPLTLLMSGIGLVGFALFCSALLLPLGKRSGNGDERRPRPTKMAGRIRSNDQQGRQSTSLHVSSHES